MKPDEIIEMANKASKEWLKELPTPEETANQVPKRFLEIFAKLVAAKEREACAKLVQPTEEHRREAQHYIGGEEGVELLDNHAEAIRARGQA